MTHAQFLRIKKLTGESIIEVAARHNHREILAELGAMQDSHIDPSRVCLNRVLRGRATAKAIDGDVRMMMDRAGVKVLRKDAVRGLEIIFSLPPQSYIDQGRFFNESVRWTEQYFSAPIISAIVHNDEAAPHCHVLLLPLINGRMVGSDLMGGRAKLKAMQADFHDNVGRHHGLIQQAPQNLRNAATRQQAIDSAYAMLEANSGLAADVLRALLEPHARNPHRLLMVLGLSAPKPQDTFAKIMTRPCKTEISARFDKRNPIGFDGSKVPENEQTLSCVGLANSTPSFPPPAEPPPAQFVIASAPAIPMLKGGCKSPKYPKQFKSSRADVLASWLSPDEQAGPIRVLRGSLCLNTVVRALIRKYHWQAERRDIKTNIGDGRAAWSSVYSLPQEAIDAALNSGGREWLEAYRAAQSTQARGYQ